MTIGRIPEEKAGNWAKSIKGREGWRNNNYKNRTWVSKVIGSVDFRFKYLQKRYIMLV